MFQTVQIFFLPTYSHISYHFSCFCNSNCQKILHTTSYFQAFVFTIDNNWHQTDVNIQIFPICHQYNIMIVCITSDITTYLSTTLMRCCNILLLLLSCINTDTSSLPPLSLFPCYLFISLSGCYLDFYSKRHERFMSAKRGKILVSAIRVMALGFSLM